MSSDAAAGERGPAPLLLLHGICSRETVFTRPARGSLGRLLSTDFRLLLGRLRSGRGGPWDFDTHLEQDLAEIWAGACAEFGRPPAVLGYSMGGMLALVAQARGVFQAPALILVATPVVFPAIPFYPALMRTALTLARHLGWRRIPTRLVARILVWFFAGGNPARIDPGLRLFHAFIRGAGVDVPTATLAEATAWVETGRFVDRTGRRDYLEELGRISSPCLFLAGADDRIAPPESVRKGFDAVSSKDRTFGVLPGANHLSLANGEPAAEVARRVQAWSAGRIQAG